MFYKRIGSFRANSFSPLLHARVVQPDGGDLDGHRSQGLNIFESTVTQDGIFAEDVSGNSLT